ncbi:Phosphatidylinositol 3-kinase catalytic subunit type 3 [Halotydeus destructor]|nr:Phosphatidylinositol 3-kinase catalytic subunit type 3 [Halotydeus destructor]
MNDSNSENDRFRYVYTTDLEDVLFRIKIGTLEGSRPKPDYKDLISNPILRFSGLYLEEKSDLQLTINLFSNGNALCPPKHTSYKHFKNWWSWNEWLMFPVRYSDLPRDTVVVFTVWDSYGPGKPTSIGGTSLSVFGKYGSMRRGLYDLRIWPELEANGPCTVYPSGKSTRMEESARLSKLKKRYENGHMLKVDWLDKLTFPEAERIREHEKRSSNGMYLTIEFSKIVIDGFSYQVVYFEKEADESCQLSFESDIISVPDPDLLSDNLVENKHHKLSRSTRSGYSDRDLKPNPQIRDQLNSIVSYPSTKVLTSEEQDILWKFRFYLLNQKKALTKFLKCLNWEQTSEVHQALELITSWQPIDIEDALELLSHQFQHPSVRRYAVSRLQQAPDEDLHLYLLQLVQALKYEDLDEVKAGLVQTRRQSLVVSVPFTEVTVSESKKRNSTASDPSFDKNLPSYGDIATVSETSVEAEDCDLATFLINRASGNETLANYFYWYLTVECEEYKITESAPSIERDSRVAEMYYTVMSRFSQRLLKGSKDMQSMRSMLNRQQTFVEQLVQLMRQVAREKGDRLKKVEKLQSLLSTNENFNFTSFEPMSLPLDPRVKIKGIIPEKATLFKSAMMPSRITFRTVEEQDYIAILKYGDDLRQDQLILQTITLMDKLLRRENLDLKLTPYSVLATSSKHGFVQFIDSVPVAEVLKNHNDSIQKFFRSQAACETSPYGISPEVMDTYVKSCAGYCIITYLLGVGDRHLDNLLLTKNGNLFHIDFGYILGRDPKPFPPPMKLSREMVEGMGGVQSEHYQQFRKLCYTAFLHLRRHANLILNLFTLMVGATIPDIALEPDKTVKKVQDKFRLDLTDEEAVHYIQSLIEISVTAVMASLVEQFHKFAQYWRK